MPPLAYGTNLHAAETLPEIVAEVVPFAVQVRERLGWPRLGLDLRLGSAALEPLRRDLDAFAPLRRALDHAGLSAHTINGFPLRPFQQGRVKEQAYLPDWSERERLDRSVDLLTAALALSDAPLLTISTVPGSYRPLGAARNDRRVFAELLGSWAAVAHLVRSRTGRTAILCPEPEPWCLLETSHDVAWFWQVELAEIGVDAAARALDGDRAAAATAVREHLGVCVDACHLALAFEEPRAAVARMHAAGARIAKCQASAAPEVIDPGHNDVGVDALRALAEPRFLHQVAARSAAGSLAKAADLDGLDACLARLPGATSVRSHFHIPLDRPPAAPGLASTSAETATTIAACLDAGCDHLAVETYTWSILAPEDRDRIAGTARELAWLAERAGRADSGPQSGVRSPESGADTRSPGA